MHTETDQKRYSVFDPEVRPVGYGKCRILTTIPETASYCTLDQYKTVIGNRIRRIEYRPSSISWQRRLRRAKAESARPRRSDLRVSPNVPEHPTIIKYRTDRAAARQAMD